MVGKYFSINSSQLTGAGKILETKVVKKIQFGDGSEISGELMDTVCELAENITHDHFWKKVTSF